MTTAIQNLTKAQIDQELQRIDHRIAVLVGQDAAQRRQTITTLTGILCTLARLGLIDDAKVRELCAKAQACDMECLIQGENARQDQGFP